jgi:hypothetical protein
VRPTALIGVRRHKHSLTSGALAGDSHVGVDSPNPAGGVDALADKPPAETVHEGGAYRRWASARVRR